MPQGRIRRWGCAVALVAAGCVSSPRTEPLPPEQLDELRRLIVPLNGGGGDYDRLMELVGDNQFVLLGESTHGTREFYRERARLTRRLIEEKGFTVVLIEGDWPDAYDVNEFIHGRGPATAAAALATFTRFPRWMWANEEFRELVEWLRGYNGTQQGAADPAGVYGLDVYSVDESIDEVVAFLRNADAAAAQRAEERYRCLARVAARMDEYGVEVAAGIRTPCRDGAAAQFKELAERVAAAGPGHRPGDDQLISAWQNARVVLNGEAYYRLAAQRSVAAWNLRDAHMADTIDAIAQHLNEGAPRPAKVIVWAHNSHLGDARVTERSEIGELNVGQLMRQRHDGRSVLIGFTTYGGRVRAASSWGGADREQTLRPARRDSFAAVFHETGVPAFTLPLGGTAGRPAALRSSRLERFVGVIYMPATERQSHYVEADLVAQYDAIVHIDHTNAVQPIARSGP